MSGRKFKIFRKSEKHMRKNFRRKKLTKQRMPGFARHPYVNKNKSAKALNMNAFAQKEVDMKKNNNNDMINSINTFNTAKVINADNADSMDIKVTVILLQNQESYMKANASIILNGVFKVTGIRIGISKKGNIFVSMPDYKTGRLDDNGNDIYQDIVYPVTRQFRQKLYDGIVNEYQSVMKKQDGKRSKEEE